MTNLLLLLSILPFYCVSQTLPAIYRGSSGYPFGGSITIGYDSSLYVTGTINSNDTIFIMKTNLNGVILDQVKLIGNMSSFEKTKDSSFLSIHRNLNISNEITTLIKWNQNLDTLWSKSIQLNAEIKSISLSEMIDSSILISGILGPNNLCFVMVTDPLGNPIWSRTYESQNVPNLNYSQSKQQSDSTLIVVSSNVSKTASMHLDLFGNIIWTKYYDNFIAKDFIINNQKNIFIGGSTGIILTDSVGTFHKGINLWSASFQNYTLKNYMDTLISFAFGNEALGGGGWDSYINILDDSLNIKQRINYLGGFIDFDIRDTSIYSLLSGPLLGVKINGPIPQIGIEATIRPNNSCGYNQNLTSSSFLINTYTEVVDTLANFPLDTTVVSTIYLSNLTFEANCIGITSSIDEYEENLIKIYPNPTSGILTIESEKNQFIEKIEVLSIDGRIVFKKNNLKSLTTSIDLSRLPIGIYYLKAHVGNSITVEKIIRQ